MYKFHLVNHLNEVGLYIRKWDLYATVQLQTDPTSVTSSEAQPQAHLVIWGTDVNVQEAKEKFKDFIKYFMDDSEQAGEEEPMGGVEPFYMARLDEVRVFVVMFFLVRL